MGSLEIDEVDRSILQILREDARRNTNADISKRVSVSASTVGKRIARMEDVGIITGYHPDIDYEEVGFALHVLFICTAAIVDREDLIQQTLEIDGVLNVRELMTGVENVHIRVIGTGNDDITRIAHTLDTMGYAVTDEILLRGEYQNPSIPIESLPFSH